MILVLVCVCFHPCRLFKRSQDVRISHKTLQKQTKIIRGDSDLTAQKKGCILSRAGLHLQTFVIQMNQLEV